MHNTLNSGETEENRKHENRKTENMDYTLNRGETDKN